jgi:hypothetical protein
MEIVVTSQTKIYKDGMSRQFGGPAPEGGKVQQIVEPGSLDEIGQDSSITVWGKKDRRPLHRRNPHLFTACF